LPKSNEEYWVPKLTKNIERDHMENKRLAAEGWRVIRFWEHELTNIHEVSERIESELKEPKAKQ
jgi:DNA mismatch endonuclease, patch repair protein